MRPFKRAAGRLVVGEIPTEQRHATQSSPPVGRLKFRRPRSRTLWPARFQALTTRGPLFGSWRSVAVRLGLALSLFVPGTLRCEGAEPAAARVSALYDALLQTMKQAKQLGLKPLRGFPIHLCVYVSSTNV